MITKSYLIACLVMVCCISSGLYAQPVVKGGNQAKSGSVEDQALLEQARLDPNNKSDLLKYFTTRTLSEPDLSKIESVIKNLGAPSFEDRILASEQVEAFGPAAIAPLKSALTHPDPEIAYRARESLQRIEKIPHGLVAIAAARALKKYPSTDTASTLLAFLPMADDLRVEERIEDTLYSMAFLGTEVNAALIAALKDPVAQRRTMAALALIHAAKNDQQKLSLIKDSLIEMIKIEKNTPSRFEILYSWLTTARSLDLVPEMIRMIPDIPRGQFWQAEELLLHLAGASAPKIESGKARDSLEEFGKQWEQWWENNKSKIDVARLQFEPTTTGKMLLVMLDTRFGAPGAVLELGKNLKPIWRINGLLSPTDAQYFVDGKIIIAEQNASKLTVRETNGEIISSRNVSVQGQNQISGTPQQVHKLDNGNFLVVCRNLIVEYDTDFKVIMSYTRPQQYDITGACRLPGDRTLLLLQNGPTHTLIIDKTGTPLKSPALKISMPFYQAHAISTGESTVLLTEADRLAEYNTSTGELTWSHPAKQPKSVQLLPSGNVLFVDSGASSGRVVEVTRQGKEVWKWMPDQDERLQLWRAYRR